MARAFLARAVLGWGALGSSRFGTRRFVVDLGGSPLGEERGSVNHLGASIRMAHGLRGWTAATVVVALATTVAVQTSFAGEVEDALAASLLDVKAGRCAEAAARIDQIDGLESRALALGGRCKADNADYDGALADLDAAAQAGGLAQPQLAELELYRGVSLFHLERYTEAEAALDRAEAAGDGLLAEDAQLALYRGMIALRRGDNDRAAPSLESAGRMSPTTTEPLASYYAGLAWRDAAERTKAREAFRRVVDHDADGPWGKEADKLLESTELFPTFLRARAGIEYDDNVLLRALGTNPETNEDDSDGRGVWAFEAGVQVLREGPWSAGFIASYYGNSHFSKTDFDTHYPTVGTFVDYRFQPQTSARLRYTFGHAWVNGGSFLRAQAVEASLQHNWPRIGTTILTGDVSWNDFRFETIDEPNGATPAAPGAVCPPGILIVTNPPCGPASINEARERDRDGYGLGAEIAHSYLIPLAGPVEDAIESMVVRGGYRFDFYDSQGTEWERFGHTLSLGMNFEFPFDVSLDASGAYEHFDYLNPSTFPDRVPGGREYALDQDDREENAFRFEAEIDKDLNDYVSVSARYSYYDIASNRLVYRYDRHIVGGYVNFRFD